MPAEPRIAVEPGDRSRWLVGRDGSGWLTEAIRSGGGSVVAAADAQAVVWSEVDDPDGLRALLIEHPDIEWVQLPFAGIEPYRELLDDRRVWTCAKGAYGDTAAELALTLTLAGLRDLGVHLRSRRWDPRPGRNLYGAPVTIFGAGGIARHLIRLLAPFECRVTVVRRRPEPVPGAARVVPSADRYDVLGESEVVVLALALTPETDGIIDARALDAMTDRTWLVNVARGRHVVTDDLVGALDEERIAGAGLDVTDPEPLPEDHPLWSQPRCLITPHVANTFEMLRPRLGRLVAENVARFAEGESLLGRVDPEAGY